MKITHTEDAEKAWKDAMRKHMTHEQLVDVLYALATNDKAAIGAFVSQMNTLRGKHKKSK